MHSAFSRLRAILHGQGLSTADLIRRISDGGDRVNAKSLYRLADPQEPLEKVDMRVISAVCGVLEVGIGDLLTFDEPTVIEELAPAKQARLDALMARHAGRAGEGLSARELAELQDLIGEAEATARGNARRLADHRRRLLRAPRDPSPLAATH